MSSRHCSESEELQQSPGKLVENQLNTGKKAKLCRKLTQKANMRAEGQDIERAGQYERRRARHREGKRARSYRSEDPKNKSSNEEINIFI